MPLKNKIQTEQIFEFLHPLLGLGFKKATVFENTSSMTIKNHLKFQTNKSNVCLFSVKWNFITISKNHRTNFVEQKMCSKGCEFSQIHLNNFELFRKFFSTLFHQVVIQHHQTVPESISHSYVSNDRPVPTIPIEYDVLSPNQCYEKQNYVKTHSSHVMSGPYESLGQYDVISKQTNESLKQQCEKALHELNQLRRQHTETSRRCEHVMKVGVTSTRDQQMALGVEYVALMFRIFVLPERLRSH